ncbi:maturation protein [ssRNA phage Esthiorhiza.4_15]|uniref:Maturation protein n=2 Tax=Leviviricetes TaxID=2842243 RepID=A0A8S5KZD3_9VIRU|nr:maturation protein [ssRNA phage Esthiorhiza.4_15]QDH87402.1 MAG: hypothetical protein H4RhizoLitter21562_000001 [Leviviridae sp.]DAD50556.1 TPA_asm: maturation protein [ssRNA phage Esthiorhiza.4_15]
MSFLPEYKYRTGNIGPAFIRKDRTNVALPWNPRATVQGSVSESILSQCHTGHWPPMRGSTKDVGGMMDLTRNTIQYPTYRYTRNNLFEGFIVMVNTGSYFGFGNSRATAGSDSDLNVFGATAIARTIPTNPTSSMSTALAELKRDGVPSLPGSQLRDHTDLARRSGNEYLNFEFGWLPLLSDVRKFATSVKKSRQIIDQYKRDSDRKIRRRFVPDAELHSVLVIPGLTAQTSNGQNCLNSTVTKTTTTQYSFSGAFRYHVPVGDDFYSRLRQYEAYSHKLFDTRLTPELLWNIAPWSWAVDWFTNAGDVIHNISALGSDGLVMQYGYAMRHSRIEELAQGSYSFTQGGKSYSGTLTKYALSETKQRRAAHPYGFGITDASLSARQWAILAALGLTRGSRQGR